MFTTILRRAALAAALCAAAAAAAPAHEFKAGEIHIDHPWARATPGGAANGAAYLSLRNDGDQPDMLIRAETDIARSVELHTHVHENGVMKMRPVEAIEVPAHGETKLVPGGLHVMLMGLAEPLKEGEVFMLRLVFEKAGEATVEVAVEPLGTTDPMKGHGHKE